MNARTRKSSILSSAFAFRGATVTSSFPPLPYRWRFGPTAVESRRRSGGRRQRPSSTCRFSESRRRLARRAGGPLPPLPFPLPLSVCLLFAACFSFLQRQISRFGSTLTKRPKKKKKKGPQKHQQKVQNYDKKRKNIKVLLLLLFNETQTIIAQEKHHYY